MVGGITDQAELARLRHVTRARLTQIMNLLGLAPDIQVEILFLPATERGRDVVTEKQVRVMAAMADWGRQRKIWLHHLGARCIACADLDLYNSTECTWPEMPTILQPSS